MLSNTGVLVLGIIAVDPVNPYEILKILKSMDIGEWFRAAPSSVYATINNLESKGYIKGKNVKSVNMPDKTIYSLTFKGEKELEQTLADLLGNIEYDVTKTNIAVSLMYYLQKYDVLRILNDKLKKLITKKDMLKEYPPSVTPAILNLLYFIDASIQFTSELIKTVENDTGWNRLSIILAVKK